MWKTTGGGQAWPDAASRLRVSDDVLCWESAALERRLANQNVVATCPAWHDQLTDKDAAVEGQLLTARRAGCGDASARRSGASVPAGGWLLPVCADTYANNVVAAAPDGAVCAPRHQAFMNHTRRQTGREPPMRR